MSRDRSDRRSVGMRSIKRSLAAIAAALGLVAAVFALAGLGAAVEETNGDADPDTAFSATEVVPRALAGQVTWDDDDADLARRMEPTTREQLTATWLRAHDALERAAEGDRTGLEVWFVGPALDRAEARYGPDRSGDSVAASRPVAHRLRVRFYSLDGQVAVLTSDTTYERPAPGGTGERVATVERVEAIVVLADGNWRIRSLERPATGAPPGPAIETGTEPV